MNCELSRTFYMHANGHEVDTLGHILRLAARQLAQSPAIQLSGNPMKRQAGLAGTELLEVKEMISKMAEELTIGPLNTNPPAADSLVFLAGGIAGAPDA
ncbi:hypothetical protein LMG26788_03738 [Achromobacter pulmonis]|uniref:Uncharacterized protein n=1 Tax=Achromobacter pulmonis TaxID=1389932 RepID=A0A6S7DDB6_9BURK|nr:hypothetical protein [Achromobacter pulmonis]CAB3888954.1 hypothetical protein LMG26788_03672 [Achromobacter pulmonis]CAB3890252.1 hypothetical protein LMG26788_03738 [Achromobacter pulmonis]